jgi:DNA invertase Pin-like site-specific DNA recombinase
MTNTDRPMRCAIYARMSTDKQSADSPADQIARCRDFAASHGWMIVPELLVEDAGVSGASRHERPQFLEIMTRIAEWDVLLCWDFSRLARNEEDLGWVRNRLRAAKKDAHAVNTGRSIHDLGSRVEGVIAAEYLEKLKADTHRGLLGRAERGLAAGGTPYGYRTEGIPTGRTDAHGRAIHTGFRIVIHEAESVVLRRIFELYTSGLGLRAIAHRLNAERVSPPRPRGMKRLGAAWAPAAIREMLLNPIYRGEYVWNRSEWIKDHETGRRRRFERPESQWVRRELAELRLVDDDLWERVQARFRAARQLYTRRLDGAIVATRTRAAKRRHVLSGFLECEVCGGAFYAVRGGERFACAWHKDRGPLVCPSALRVHRADLESRVFGAIRERILVPEVVLYAAQRTLELVQEGLTQRDPAADRKRLDEIDVELANLARFAARTGRVDEAVDLFGELEQERGEIAARLEAGGADVDLEAMRPWIVDRVAEMRTAFESAPENAREALRVLLGTRRLRVGPDPDLGFRVEGLFVLPLETRTPWGQGTARACDSVVAGGRYGTVEQTRIVIRRLRGSIAVAA